MFKDEVTISVRAGKGGDGAISFRRVKYVPKGGPDGGHGGDGGSVYIVADANHNTLYHLAHQHHFSAKNGGNGSGQHMAGKAADDLVITVPVGTTIFEVNAKNKRTEVADLSEHGARVLIAKGGMGGKGNSNFATSTRQAPRFAELGEPGEEKKLRLELKLVGDVGIIGLPSVGKSTLISVISSARPKIAAYHFTTLVPNLGVVAHKGMSFVATDMPGLIAGASTGKGLGHQFLKHISRVRVLLHLVRADSEAPLTDYRVIRSELKKYNKALIELPELVVLSASDTVDEKTLTKLMKAFEKKTGHAPFPIAAPIHTGVDALLDATIEMLAKLPIATEAPPEMPLYRPHLLEKSKACHAKKSKGIFIIEGPRISQIVTMTDLANEEALARVQDVIHKFGAGRMLRRLGAKAGSTIEIAGKRFTWWGMADEES